LIHIQLKKLINNHNCLCLIDILYNLTQKIILGLNRTKFEVLSLSSYMYSIKEQLDNIIWYKPNELEEILSHPCDCIDIKTYDPNLVLFNQK